jgi:AraC family transcriptional regulator, transcriptional activator of pobA
MKRHPATSQQIRAEHFLPALYMRTIQPGRMPYGDFSHIFLLVSGRAEVTLGDEVQPIESLSASSFPPSPQTALTLQAGSEAYLIGAAQELLVDVIGNNAESILIRSFVEQPALVHGTEAEGDHLQGLEFLVRGFMKEAETPARGSQMAIAAYMRLILMEIWRASGWETTQTHGGGQDIAILQGFRQLVELHFRERRAVTFYADRLGLTYDRLHNICARALSRTPQDLLQERIVREANLRLERSGISVQQIAALLGFADPTYFSHFYKRATGTSPNGYRQRFQAGGSRQLLADAAKYADWP